SGTTPCSFAPITVGQTIAGSIATTDCWSIARGAGYYADQFRFTGSAGDQVSILMDADAFGTLNESYLYLIGPTGAVLQASSSGGTGVEDARIPSVSGLYSLPMTGAYTIDATTLSSGDTGAYALSLSGNTVLFTDDPLTAGATLIKAVHITELRLRIDALRGRFGLPQYVWTDPTITIGETGIKVQHILDLRQALRDVYLLAGSTPPT